MKRSLILVACLLTAMSFGQAASNGQTILKIELTKDNGKGKPGTVIKVLAPRDNPFHCVAHLKTVPSTTVFSGVLIAVNAGGARNFKVASTNLSATPPMNLLDFKFSLPRPWPTGSYKVEIRVGDKVVRDIVFDVK